MEKLMIIQSELKAPKSQYNAFGKYKYRNLEDILEALKPLLLKHNCTFTLTDCVKEVCGIVYVEAVGTFHDCNANKSVMITGVAGVDIHRKGMDVAQCFGASSSYARKYCCNGMFLIDDTKDADATNDHKPKDAVKESLTMERFNKACKLIEEGKYSSEEMKLKYALSQAQLKQLDNLLKVK
jgi:hypothetical protein